MNNLVRIGALVAVGATLAGCDETMDTGATSTPPATLSVADQACQESVRAQTNNPDVVVLESLFSEAGTLVTLGVGPDRARWSCTSTNDGIVQNVQSQVNEGTL
ncbi:hypothetical protein CLV78_107163 [Aliiruegeria haliotis]|uniref:Uncharacterized protein n=1 Tax=Aliiruegeria haliotis TaxID=1280846 RepID=A0A2T0RM27_9RHOB|nr:hypothetical protein [Aliiruegeria haliotis]PRY22239.1 hypothetical protein CLV78_107163 [Aliiruegeria haliotis]